MKRKFFSSLILSLLLVTFVIPYVDAAKSVNELKEEMAEREEQRKKIEKEINSKKSEYSEKIKERNSLDLQISNLMEDIEAFETAIEEKQAEIEEKEKQINDLNVIIEENTDKLKTRMKVMYEYGGTSYLDILFEAKGLGDFFTRIAIVKDIVQHDRDLINTYVNARTEIENAKATIEKEQQEQIEAKSILDAKKKEIEAMQKQKEAIIKELNSDIKNLERQEAQAESDYNQLRAELDRALGKTPTTSYTGSGKFVWPAESSRRVTSPFGNRKKPNAKATSYHRGIDIGAPSGSNVLAAESGTVVTAGYNSSYGYYITINHGGGYVTLYAHNSKLLVSKGQSVSKGQVIAKVGSTGNSTGPHVHFEVMVNGTYKDPMSFF